MAQPAAFDYEGPPEFQVRIDRALRWVTHPLLRLNVLDAGLVYGVSADGERVRVRLAMTTPGCSLTDLLVEDVQAEIFDHLGGERRVEVEVVSTPPWSPARMRVVPFETATLQRRRA